MNIKTRKQLKHENFLEIMLKVRQANQPKRKGFFTRVLGMFL